MAYVDCRYEPSTNHQLIGAPGTDIFRLRVPVNVAEQKDRAVYTLVFVYMRPWEEVPIATRSIVVAVPAAGTA